MKTGSCSCSKCAALCQRKPGIFAPGEATKAAASIGLSLPEFFKRYGAVDFWQQNRDPEPIHFITPAWQSSDPLLSQLLEDMRGRHVSFAEGFMFGPCALLTPTGCRLSFENRPAECRAAYGCEPDPNLAIFGVGVKEEIVEKWKAPEGAAEIDAAFAEVKP